SASQLPWRMSRVSQTWPQGLPVQSDGACSLVASGWHGGGAADVASDRRHGGFCCDPNCTSTPGRLKWEQIVDAKLAQLASMNGQAQPGQGGRGARPIGGVVFSSQRRVQLALHLHVQPPRAGAHVYLALSKGVAEVRAGGATEVGAKSGQGAVDVGVGEAEMKIQAEEVLARVVEVQARGKTKALAGAAEVGVGEVKAGEGGAWSVKGAGTRWGVVGNNGGGAMRNDEGAGEV
ncbi:hypothetical protein EJB05_50902, partial [Eragrostis curvula]